MSNKSSIHINHETYEDSSESEEETEVEPSYLKSGSYIGGNAISRLEDLPWFHGDMSRNTSEALLLSNALEGTYLLRCSNANPGKFSISARCQDSVKHYTLEYDPYTKSYVFGKGQFDSLGELIDHFDCQPILSNIHGHTVTLKYPYMKDVQEPNMYEDVIRHAECGNTLRTQSIPDLHIASKEGFLVKRGAIHKNWNRRWFVLQKNLLKYYKKKDSADPIRTIDLKDANEVSLSAVDNKDNCFELSLPYRTFYFHGKAQDDTKQWMKLLQWKIDYYIKEKEKEKDATTLEI